MAFFDNAKQVFVDNKEVKKLMLGNKIIFEKGGDESEYTVTFTIFDDDTNNPIHGATVTLGSDTETTDVDGTCTFDNITEDSYSVTVSASGYTSETKSITVDSAHTSFSISLVAIDYSVCITVLDNDDTPISDAIVSVGTETLTDGVDGEYEFYLYLGTYPVEVNVPSSGWCVYSGNITVTEEDTDFTIQFYNVTVTVVDTNNSPVEGATVEFGMESETTNSDGEAVLHAPDGEYSLSASAEEIGTGDAGNVTVDAEHTTFTVTLI